MGPSAGSRRGKGGEKSKVPYRSDGVAGRVRHAFGGPDRGAKQSVARAWRRCLFYPTCSLALAPTVGTVHSLFDMHPC